MMAWLPLWLVDGILLILAWFIIGDTDRYGIKRPSSGPLELKNNQGKSPVLDIGALEKIRSGDIAVVPGVKRFSRSSVELVSGEKLEIDSVVLATGYRSNVPYWLQVRKCSKSNLKHRKILTFSRIKRPTLIFLAYLSGNGILLQEWISKNTIPERVERKGWALCCRVHKEGAIGCICRSYQNSPRHWQSLQGRFEPEETESSYPPPLYFAVLITVVTDRRSFPFFLYVICDMGRKSA